MARNDNRNNDDLRNFSMVLNFTKHAEGSVLVSMGDTKVICTATVEEKVPGFKKGSGEGWVTAEYSMLPRATEVRNSRDISRLKLSARSQEIQRLIGRALRSVVDLKTLGERTITIDCDVIQADGGTRTASVNGGFIAMVLAMDKLIKSGTIAAMPVSDYIAAISVGVVKDEVMVDLCYSEDSTATVDMNVVMTDKGEIIEIQGTGEKRPFTESELSQMLKLSKNSINAIIGRQKEYLKEIECKIGGENG